MEKLIKTLEEIREQIRAEAEVKMDDITRTIEILRGCRPVERRDSTLTEMLNAPETTGETPSVRDMLIQAGEAIAEEDESIVFTFDRLKGWCVAKWPSAENKIRNGIYPAVNLIVESGVWDRDGRGFKITQKAKS